MTLSYKDLRAFHKTHSALETNVIDGQHNPLDYCEYQLTQNAAELIGLTRRAYTVQKLRDLANEIEMQGRIS